MNYQFQKLANGTRLVTVPMKDTQTSAILIGVRVGSRDEKDAQAGSAHFLEHMFFKGTKKRPTYLDISRELDGLGANFNAFTSQEMTSFYIQAAYDKQRQAAEILFDILQNNTFPQAEIIKEKAVIIEEINMYEDMPQSKASQEFMKLIFKGTSLGRPIAGDKKNIEAVTREGLRQFFKIHYIPPQIVCAIAGKIDKETINFIKQKLLGQGKAGKPLPYPQFKRTFTEQNNTINKGIDQAHIVLGYGAFSIHDPRRFALNILNSILGGMMSSRLFIEIREKRGLAYYVKASPAFFMDTGLLAIEAGLAKTKLAEGIEAIRGEVEKFKEIKVSETELKRAKDNFIGHLYLGLEDSLDVAQFYLNQLLLKNEINTPAEIIKRVEKVSKDDIIELANILFDKKRENLVIVK